MPLPAVPAEQKQRAAEQIVFTLKAGDRWDDDLVHGVEHHRRIPQAVTKAAIEQLINGGAVEVVELIREFRMRKLRLTSKPMLAVAYQ